VHIDPNVTESLLRLVVGLLLALTPLQLMTSTLGCR
jgi:hypothetical protein